MDTISAKKLNLSSIMIEREHILPVIKANDVLHKEPIYLVRVSEFERVGSEDIVHLYFSQISDGQIRMENTKVLNTVPGLYTMKKNLVIIV